MVWFLIRNWKNGKIAKSNENKLVDFRHLGPLCDGSKAAGVKRPIRMATSASTRKDTSETEMLRIAMEKSWNQMKTNWWILDIWNRCVTVGRPPVLEANAAAYGGFDYVVREHRAAASCKAVQPLFCWEE